MLFFARHPRSLRNFLCMHAQRRDILSNCEVNGLKLEGSSRPVSSSWGIAPTPLMGQRWFLKQSVKPIPITVWWTRDKAAYMLSQALSAIYYFYLFTNKHKNLLLTYLSFFLKRFFKKILKITSLKRYHRIIMFKEIHKSKYNSLKKAY